MLYFAYDGSINCDWIAHYALRMAQAQPEPALEVLHILDGSHSDNELNARLERLRVLGEAAGVTVRIGVHEPRGDVTARLEMLVPSGAQSLLLCGTRAREGGRGLLTGTVAERLLDRRHSRVLAMRVVHPGQLGRPERVLVPLSGAPAALETVGEVLVLLAQDLRSLSLLSVEPVRRGRLRRLSYDRTQALLAPRRAYLAEAEHALTDRLGPEPVALETHVTVSDDITREIVNAANRAGSRMILLGASRRSRLERLWQGNPLEGVLAYAPCDVAVYCTAKT